MTAASEFFSLWDPTLLDSGPYSEAQKKLDKSAAARFAAGVFPHLRKQGSAEAAVVAELMKVLKSTTTSHPRRVLPKGLADWAGTPPDDEPPAKKARVEADAPAPDVAEHALVQADTP